MAHKDKADRARYMREYRARLAGTRQPRDFLGRPVAGEATSRVEDTDPKVAVPAAVSPAARPPFLAAPVDECPLCHHDRQEADHLGGRPCKYREGRRACGCSFEGF